MVTKNFSSGDIPKMNWHAFQNFSTDIGWKDILGLQIFHVFMSFQEICYWKPLISILVRNLNSLSCSFHLKPIKNEMLEILWWDVSENKNQIYVPTNVLGANISSYNFVFQSFMRKIDSSMSKRWFNTVAISEHIKKVAVLFDESRNSEERYIFVYLRIAWSTKGCHFFPLNVSVSFRTL